MSLLSNVDSANVAVEEKDNLGGGLPDSGAYLGELELAYLSESPGGAVAVNIHFKGNNGVNVRQAIYVTSGTAKGKKTYFENRQGERTPLPGFVVAEAIAQLTVGKGILEVAQNTEKKVVNIYNRELGREVPTEVEALTEVMGQQVCLGVIKSVENKSDKVPQADGTNKYVPNNETRETIEVEKVFRGSDGATVAEAKANAEPVFITKWREKWEGKTRDRVKKVENGPRAAGSARGAAPGQAGGGGSTAPSLFGNKS